MKQTSSSKGKGSQVVSKQLTRAPAIYGRLMFRADGRNHQLQMKQRLLPPLSAECESESSELSCI